MTNKLTSGLLRFCDVSKWQADVNWAVTSTRLDFAYAKASQANFTDPQWVSNYLETKSLGFPLGMYHYYDNKVSWKVQADYFMSMYDKYPTGLLPALDLEKQTVNPKVADLLNFVADVMEHIGAHPIIYTSPSYIQQWFWNIPEMSQFPLWIANYATDPKNPLPAPRIPLPWFAMDWWGWQFSADGNNQGKYYGSTGSLAIDLNVAWTLPILDYVSNN